MELVPVIGLEVHIQLKTKTKMFCSCDNAGENKEPNTCVCPVCLGHPGMLPVINKQAVEWAVMTAQALNCTIDPESKFDRKHYFYPDLPKAYQISQYDKPIGRNGSLWIYNEETGLEEEVLINRLHLEEDAAKLLHTVDKAHSSIDYNRGGTPLMEIVSEPVIKSASQAKNYLQELRQIVRYLGVSDADMEKGHLRCDANISLHPEGEEKLYPKTEIKNINSFRNVEKAIEYEISRQTKLWLEGNPPKILTTRGWSDTKEITEEQRVKEEAHDYRYFPDPDLPPLHFTDGENATCDPNALELDIACTRAALPELPNAKRKRFMSEFDLPYEDVLLLTIELDIAEFTEETISELQAWISSLDRADSKNDFVWEKRKPELTKLAANWIINRLMPYLEEHDHPLKKTKLTPENLSELISMVYTGQLNNTTALDVFIETLKTGEPPARIVKEKGLEQISDTGALEKFADEVISKNERAVADFREGKEKALQALMGQIMAKTKGKANPQVVTDILKKKLS